MNGDGHAWIRGSMIGKGSFGRVYHATLKNQTSEYRRFPLEMAVKSAEVSVSSSIEKEMEVLKQLKGCPNYIIECYGEETTTDTDGETWYNLLLEYASGGSLNDRIKKTGGRGLLEIEAKVYARSILRGLKHIHELGYVHCDLKPDNILLVDELGKGQLRAKIGDFGCTKKLGPSTGIWEGTRGYLSPEAVMNGVQETPSDIWAVGCIVVKMLTAKTIFVEGENKLETLTDIGQGLERVRIPKEVCDEARAFLDCCFVTNPELRWTAEELLSHKFLQDLADDDDEVFASNIHIGSTALIYNNNNNEHTCGSSVADNDNGTGRHSFIRSCNSSSQGDDDDESSDDYAPSVVLKNNPFHILATRETLKEYIWSDAAASFGIHVGM